MGYNDSYHCSGGIMEKCKFIIAILIALLFNSNLIYGQTPNGLELGGYYSIVNHPKSKGVNLKIKVPIGWEIKEGNRPSIVTKFVKNTNMFIVSINENKTFFSKKIVLEAFKDTSDLSDFAEEMIQEYQNYEILRKRLVTIEDYPTVNFLAKVTLERNGLEIPVIVEYWVVYYEDMLVLFQGFSSENYEKKEISMMFSLIVNSALFLDKYE